MQVRVHNVLSLFAEWMALPTFHAMHDQWLGLECLAEHTHSIPISGVVQGLFKLWRRKECTGVMSCVNISQVFVCFHSCLHQEQGYG